MENKKASSMTRILVSNEIKKNFIIPMLQMLESIDENCNMSEDDFKKYRKSILDSGNDTIRKVERHLSNVDMKFAIEKRTNNDSRFNK